MFKHNCTQKGLLQTRAQHNLKKKKTMFPNITITKIRSFQAEQNSKKHCQQLQTMLANEANTALTYFLLLNTCRNVYVHHIHLNCIMVHELASLFLNVFWCEPAASNRVFDKASSIVGVFVCQLGAMMWPGIAHRLG